MPVSELERTAHALRRLSMGAHPDLLARLSSPAAAIEAALDLSAPAPTPLVVPVPAAGARPAVAGIVEPIVWWLEQMRASPRLIEERLVWFWHDHFATAVAKVKEPYLMVRQHQTLRRHATGSFAALLHAMARDPAMLWYLDGISNRAGAINENFGRECLELFTLGRDAAYTQDDVVAMSRACSGWVFHWPGRPGLGRVPAAPFEPVLLPSRHDRGVKTLLGRTGPLDLDAALDVVLARPETGRFVASKLYRELVGLDPAPAVVEQLGAEFARDYEILPLVRNIVATPEFLSDAAVRSRVRSPVERLVALLQATGTPASAGDAARRRLRRDGASGSGALLALRALGYVPFNPPNVGGYPKGSRLLGPHQLVHGFDLLAAVPEADLARVPTDPDETFARLGAFDVSARSRRVVAAARTPGTRLALAFGAPEVVLA